MKALITLLVTVCALAVVGVSNAAAPARDCPTSKPSCPVLQLSTASVQGGEAFTVSAQNFGRNADATLYLAAAGSPPYYSLPATIGRDGTYSATFSFTGCATISVQVVFTLVDNRGNQASASLQLC